MPMKVTFDTAGDPDTINFGIGQPSEDLLPVGLMRSAAEGFLSRASPQELNYGERQGDAAFREALADLLSAEYGAKVKPNPCSSPPATRRRWISSAAFSPGRATRSSSRSPAIFSLSGFSKTTV